MTDARIGPMELPTSAQTLVDGPLTITRIRVMNTSGSLRTVTISIGVDAVGNRIYAATPLPAGTGQDLYGPFTLGASDFVQAYASGAGVVIMFCNSLQTAHDFFWSGSEFFSDDFVRLNRGGDATNSELEWYLPQNITLDGSGHLNIQAKVESHSGSNYTSGMIQWNGDTVGSVLFGTFAARVKVAGGAGPWPAWWLLGSGCQFTNVTTADNGGTCQWPDRAQNSSEIDFIEFLGPAPHTQLNCRIHTDAALNQGATVNLGFDAAADFHTYSLEWSAGKIVWLVDGNTLFTLNSANVPAHPMFLIQNVAVGGVGGGPVTDGTLPQSSLIDWVSYTP